MCTAFTKSAVTIERPEKVRSTVPLLDNGRLNTGNGIQVAVLGAQRAGLVKCVIPCAFTSETCPAQGVNRSTPVRCRYFPQAPGSIPHLRVRNSARCASWLPPARELLVASPDVGLTKRIPDSTTTAKHLLFPHLFHVLFHRLALFSLLQRTKRRSHCTVE